MCQLKSAIVLKDKVFMPLDYDSHEEMIKELGLNDKTSEPNFVRVEITPPGNDFSKPPKDWIYKVDQDFLPKWYSAKFAEKETREALEDWYKQRVVVNSVVEKIDKGVWFVGNGGTVQKVWGGTVQEVLGGTVQEVWGGTVQVFGNDYKIGEIKDTGIVILRNEETLVILTATGKVKARKL
jgi:hypothetical protein